MKGGGSREPLLFQCRSSFLPLFFPIPKRKTHRRKTVGFSMPGGKVNWSLSLPYVILSEAAQRAAKSKNLILSMLFSNNWVKDPSTR